MFSKMIVSMEYVTFFLCALMILACGDETSLDSAGVYTDNGKGCGNGSDYNGQYDYSRRVYYGNDAVYWSTASKDSLNSVALILRSADHHVSFGAYGYAKFNTAPVRCVKD